MKKYGSYIAILLLGLGLGYLLFHGEEEVAHAAHQHMEIDQTWTCSMHPQIRQAEKGDCPICGMDLVPLTLDGVSTDVEALGVSMSPTAMQLANVQTAMVGREQAVKTIRLNGKVQFNEQAVFSQTSHISGRIERLLVTYTGQYVRKGETIAYIYSPELVTAQEELFEAQKMSGQQPALFQAAKNKLKNWKLTDQQIEELLTKGKPLEDFPILADFSGVVTNLKVNLGEHLMEGAALYEVTNLSTVWLVFEVYERDLAWLKQGSEIEYTVQAFPNESFTGEISFIDPVLDPTTRIVQARVVVHNKKQRLKPGMFVIGNVTSQQKKNKEEIIVPKSAVMWTGKRSIVYLKKASSSGTNFQLREVTLGASLGESYVIKKGLRVGEELVVNGTFSVDAAAQLAGKPSMMNPLTNNSSTDEEVMSISLDQKTSTQFDKVLAAYFELKDGLVLDDKNRAQQAIKKLQKSYQQLKKRSWKGDAKTVWLAHHKGLNQAVSLLEKANSLADIRELFMTLSIKIIALTKHFKVAGQGLFILHCPMANQNKGADWLSRQSEVLNPYFGASMLTCGSLKGEL